MIALMAHHKHKTNRRSFTPRKRRLLQNLVSGKFPSNYKAAIAAGYAPGATAKNAASRVLKEARQNLPELLDRMGLTNEALISRHLVPALNADEIRLAQKDGKFTDSAAVPDWSTRIRALEMTLQLSGAFDEGKGAEAAPAAMTIQILNSGQSYPDAKTRQGPATELPSRRQSGDEPGDASVPSHK